MPNNIPNLIHSLFNGVSKFEFINPKIKNINETIIAQILIPSWFINGYKPIIKNTIGKDTWENLNDNQKSAIISITYNYGRVPKRIRQAIKSGDPIVGANAIRKLATDNDGINKDRRLEEASMFEGATSSLMSRTGSK